MASITDQTKWRRVLNHVAADLKAVIDIAAGQSVGVTQGTAANLKALVTLAGLRGIIPNPITATQVHLADSVSAAEVKVVYTGVADKKLFIDTSWIFLECSTAGFKQVILAVRDHEDVYSFTVQELAIATVGGLPNGLTHLRAIEVPALYDVYLQGNAGNMYGVGGIHGWLEDV